MKNEIRLGTQKINIRLFTSFSEAQDLDWKVHLENKDEHEHRRYTNLFSDLIHTCRNFNGPAINWFHPASIHEWDVTPMFAAQREIRPIIEANAPYLVEASLTVEPGSLSHLNEGPLNLFAVDVNCLYKHGTHWSVGWVLGRLFSCDANAAAGDEQAVQELMGRSIAHVATNGGFDFGEDYEGVHAAMGKLLDLMRKELPVNLGEITFVRCTGRFLLIYYK